VSTIGPTLLWNTRTYFMSSMKVTIHNDDIHDQA
jgi:hypothetical protein